MRKTFHIFAFLAILTLTSTVHSVSANEMHGISMHGNLKYPAGFSHFEYVNPKAPKGGVLKLGELRSFDSLNPFIIKGAPAQGLRTHVFESLLARAYDEPFSLYGLLAKSVEVPKDRSSITFHMDERARFSDGKAVTVEDVIHSHTLLKEMGRPNHRHYYAKVIRIERPTPSSVRFVFTPDGDREMPLIMGLMPILPKHIYTKEKFNKTTLSLAVGSGPYTVGPIEPGKVLVLKKQADYWGQDLPVNRGRFNFDRIRYEYFRDINTMFLAFQKGLIHIRLENDPGRWARDYKFPAVSDGRIKLVSVPLKIPAGMKSLVFNTRKEIFKDKHVREALTLLFDFEWINKNIYHGLYKRLNSYFDRSALSSHGQAADATEKVYLQPFKGSVRPDLLAGKFKLPVTDGSGRDRKNMRAAIALLKKAGYKFKNRQLVHSLTGKAFSFEMLARNKDQERLFLNFAQSLKRLGIKAIVRSVESAQFQQRRTNYNYDMIENTWFASLSPGNEQSFRWGSETASQPGSYNFAGVSNPAVDAMIKHILAARDRSSFESAVRALDRALLSGYYVIPLFFAPDQWVAHSAEVNFPAKHGNYGILTDTMWANQK